MPKRMKNILWYSFLSSASWNMYQIIFNLYLRDLKMSNVFISGLMSLQLWGSAILGMILGMFGDRYGRKKMLLITSYISGVVILIRAIFPFETLLLWLAFFNGGLFASRMILLNTFIVEVTDHSNRAKAFGYNFGIMMGSGLIGNIIGGALGDVLGLKNTLIISSIVYLLSSITLLKVGDVKIKKKQKISELFNFKSIPKNELHILKGYLLSTFLIGFGAGLFIHFGNLIFKDLFSMTPTMIGVAISIAQVGTALGSFASPYLSKKFGPLEYTLFLQFLVVPLILAFAFVREPYTFTTLYALRFSFMNMTIPVITTLVMSNLPADKITTINSLNNLLNNSTRAIATAMFGIIVGTTNGYRNLFLISTVFYLLNFFVYLKFFYPLRKEKKTLSLYKIKK